MMQQKLQQKNQQIKKRQQVNPQQPQQWQSKQLRIKLEIEQSIKIIFKNKSLTEPVEELRLVHL